MELSDYGNHLNQQMHQLMLVVIRLVLVYNLLINAQQPWLSSHFDRLSGWIKGPHEELLFWVPQQYRDMGMLWLPEHTGVLGREEVKIQWQDSVHGVDWASCYVGRQG